ncbi:MAG: alanine dehydrogenase [Nitrosospira sp.]|nr:alanine dehydrogenase [Nitrosospira sp.]MDW7642167.1 alanine dehydrogenase [Nitrosomonadaceae bacterium]MBI0415805.1 alanine dehydrogenase [Nitrosospira sp.]MBI0417563.1 alanine dehydrogenase [Nitrosospira sp.]MBI0418764.1 alanine dehydrogenase [Nitrosospira sp.]
MRIGIPKEIKNHEYRVGLTPNGVALLKRNGHQIFIEQLAGIGAGFSNQQYIQAGAEIVGTADEVFANADMIIKIKEPQSSECKMLRSGQILFTYLHLAPDPEQAKLLLEADCIAMAYETVTDAHGGLPLLKPMSEVAGRMSIQVGAHYLEKSQGGSGILLAGVPGVPAANVLILGGGIVGANAARMAIGLGAKVTIMDISLSRLTEIDNYFGHTITTEYSSHEQICERLLTTDLLIGGVLIPGANAPKLISKDMLKHMRAGSVVVDVAIDQGGCLESSRPTTHEAPSYIVNDVVHYCVANMPGAVARTSTLALTNASLPFILEIANKGYVTAMQENLHLKNGLNVYRGNISHVAVAAALGYPLSTI